MELSVQSINIKVGKHKVVLNNLDAKELGVMAGDRVKLKDHGYITAIVDTTDDIFPQGTIGAYHEIMEQINDATSLEITPAIKPASVSTICVVYAFIVFFKAVFSSNRVSNSTQNLINSIADFKFIWHPNIFN